MSVYCIDRTKGKLFLALEMLSFLNEREEETELLIPGEFRPAYAAFLRLFPRIKISPDKNETRMNRARLCLCFCEQAPKETGANELFFPIIAEKEKAAWTAQSVFCPGQFIPTDSVKKFSSYLTGEQLSAQDMLLRRLTKNDLTGKRILISAGPTAEDIDPVRYLTNRSTGKMGLALARAAFIRGAEVELVLGPSALSVPAYLKTERVRSAGQMAEAVFSRFHEADVYIGAAAVADYKPRSLAQNKIKKGDQALAISLRRTTDILKTLQQNRQRQILIGFSVETDREYENSKRKLIAKKLDLIVINNPKQAGAAFAADTNVVSMYSKDGRFEQYPLLSKTEVSHIILDRLVDLFAK